MTLPFELPFRLEDRQRQALVALARKLLIQRNDSASNFAGYVDAAAACTDQTFAISDLAAFAPPEICNATRAFRSLMNSPRWPESALVDALFETAQLNRRKVVVIEYEYPSETQSRNAIVSLQALGNGTTVSLDWRRFCVDGDDHDEQLLRCVHELLGEMLRRYQGTAEDLPTVVTLDESLGEWPALRHSIAERVGSYGMLVSSHYTQARVNTDVYFQRNPGRRLADSFGSWPPNRPPQAMPLKRSKGRFVEYAVPLSQSGCRRYAIVGTGPRLGGQIQGRTTVTAADSIGALLSLVRHSSMALALRLHSFLHRSDRVFRRHALLLSALHAILAGHLDPSELSLPGTGSMHSV
jgi:hypothetical protein